MIITRGYIADMQDSFDTIGLGFMKMHGAGNDFVVIDSRDGDSVVTTDLARALGDRNFGVGFDQLAEILADETHDILLKFWNADGSRSAACGNATRCVANYLMAETGQSEITIKTSNRVLHARQANDGAVWVNMGLPLFSSEDIPLAPGTESTGLPLPGAPDAVGMGNPHCIFFVDDLGTQDIAKLGATYESDPLFPSATNVEFVQIISRDLLRVRVWERGTGITLACGSGACAALVAAYGRGLTSAKASVEMDGGILTVDWKDDGIWLSGPTMHVFNAELTPEFLRSI